VHPVLNTSRYFRSSVNIVANYRGADKEAARRDSPLLYWNRGGGGGATLSRYITAVSPDALGLPAAQSEIYLAVSAIPIAKIVWTQYARAPAVMTLPRDLRRKRDPFR